MYDDSQTSSDLTAKAEKLVAEIEAVCDRAKKERRDLTKAEAKEIDRKTFEVDKVSAVLERRRYADPGYGAPAIALPPTEARSAFGAVAKGQLREEITYRPDTGGSRSFLRDLYNSRQGDSEARERLYRNELEASDAWQQKTGFEGRDMFDSATQGGNFVPPLYLADVWVEPSISKRPLADALPGLRCGVPEGGVIDLLSASQGQRRPLRSGANWASLRRATARAIALPPSRTSETPVRRRGGLAAARLRAAGSGVREPRPRPARVHGARSLGGSGRERGAARSRTYVRMTSGISFETIRTMDGRRKLPLTLTLIAAAALVGLFAGRGAGSPATAGVAARTFHVDVAAALRTGGRLTVIGTGLPDTPTLGDGWYGFSAVTGSILGPTAYIIRCPESADWCGDVESIDWSTNGRWLALSVTSLGGVPRYNGLHVVDLKTGIDRIIRSWRENEWLDLDWSPDGSRLALVSGARIYTVNRDGSGMRRLRTGTTGRDSSPSWSPDGRQIVFAARRPHTRPSVYRVHADGTHRILVVHGASEPAFSPRGAKIAVLSLCGGIKLITLAGRDVTPGAGRCRTIGLSGIPVWSPDGRRIAIAGHRGNPVFNGQGVYVMNAKGEHLRRLTSARSTGLFGGADASWQPHHQS